MAAIIGITGTIGAGKGAIVDYLITKGFKHFSARQFLLEEILRRGMPPVRDTMTFIADEFRRERGPEFMIGELISRAKRSGSPAIVESIRSINEVDLFRMMVPDGYFIAVDADPKTRFERVCLRGSSTDYVSFEKFLEDEQKENNNIEPWRGNLSACIKSADVVFSNDGSLAELHAKIDLVLGHIWRR
ncbi:MAG: AAA family ATPase [Candidatus Paceibacterota bacterium]|jgi:hypothetical protein